MGISEKGVHLSRVGYCVNNIVRAQEIERMSVHYMYFIMPKLDV